MVRRRSLRRPGAEETTAGEGAGGVASVFDTTGAVRHPGRHGRPRGRTALPANRAGEAGRRLHPRRARSASQSIVPTSTGASKAIGEIIPNLKGKIEGVAMRVPTPNVSLIELIFCTKKVISKEKINDAFAAASRKQLNKVLEITEEKLVSIDFNHNSASAIIDSSLTSVVGKDMGKISAWYDNEWGFSNRMCDIAEYVNKIS